MLLLPHHDSLFKKFLGISGGIEQALEWTSFAKALRHVDKMYSEALGTDTHSTAKANLAFRNNVQVLYNHYCELIPDVHERTDVNPMSGLSRLLGDQRSRRPWVFTRNVAEGTAACQGWDKRAQCVVTYPTSRQHWRETAEHIIDNQMPKQPWLDQ